MSERAISTAVSDFVLAGCTYYAAINVYEKSLYAAWGLICVAVAASLGVLNFGKMLPRRVHSDVIRLHALFTWLASSVGIPFIAAGFCFYHQKPANATFHFVSSVGACLLSLVHTPLKENISIVVSSLAVIGILLVSSMNSNFSASAGALAYGLASAVKSTNFLGLPGVDWFHYVLAVANLLLMFGLIK